MSRIAAGLGVLGLGVLGVGALALAARRAGRQPISGRVLVIGDSIAVGTGAALGSRALTRAVVGEGVQAFDRLLDERLAAGPGLPVVLSIGTNSLDQDPYDLALVVQGFVDDIRADGRRAILLGPPPARGATAFRDPAAADRLWRYAVLTGRIADSVDLWELLGDPQRPGYYAPELGARDGLHPNAAGYREIARAITEGQR